MSLDSPVFCTTGDLDRLLSSAGVISFADHDQSGTSDSDVVEDCINQATSEIYDRAAGYYSLTALSGSRTINRWCTVMSAYFLCMRRANEVPASIQAEFDRITNTRDGLLILLFKGTYMLAGVPRKADFGPSMSNLTVSRFHPVRKIRVQANSRPNDVTTTKQDKDDLFYPVE